MKVAPTGGGTVGSGASRVNVRVSADVAGYRPPLRSAGPVARIDQEGDIFAGVKVVDPGKSRIAHSKVVVLTPLTTVPSSIMSRSSRSSGTGAGGVDHRQVIAIDNLAGFSPNPEEVHLAGHHRESHTGIAVRIGRSKPVATPSTPMTAVPAMTVPGGVDYLPAASRPPAGSAG